MKTPYLIQRGKFKGTPQSKIRGINSLIRFDYMGAAEFEQGALPKSLKRIVNNINTYTINKVEGYEGVQNQDMYVCCKQEEVEDIIINAMLLACNQLKLKERCDIRDYMSGMEYANDFWWDIENDFMICFGEENSNNLLTAIKGSME